MFSLLFQLINFFSNFEIRLAIASLSSRSGFSFQTSQISPNNPFLINLPLAEALGRALISIFASSCHVICRFSPTNLFIFTK